METFVDIISDIGAQISKIKRCRINQQTLFNDYIKNAILLENGFFPFTFLNKSSILSDL